jgi:hypothetical protein
MKRKYVWWGLRCGLTVLVCLVVLIVVMIAFSFNGQCGGLMPFLSGPRPCSFWEYFSGETYLTLLIVLVTYWPVVLGLLVVPVSVGYLLDRRSNSGRR